MIALSIVIAVAAILVIGGLVSNDIPQAYRQRQCMGRAWHRRFPESSKEDVRQFLGFFASAFAIKQRNALLFGPDDELLSIYRARYPSKLTPDALEFETLARDVEQAHNFSLASVWHEGLTLGELFEELRRARLGIHS
jgi:propanediol dehydratase small subunit